MAPLVAIPADNRHFEGYDWHAAPHQYVAAAMEGAGVMPVIVPGVSAGADIDAVLDRVEGVMITGSRSNVHPSRYGIGETPEHGPFDEGRDAVSIALIKGALDRGLPLLAICRGLQELNVALGGTLDTEIHTLADRMDHRKPQTESRDEAFAVRHPVTVAEGSCLAAILGAGPVPVNSLHRQAIAAIAPGLQVEALAEDGTIEAVSVIGAKGFAVGVQWHPEYWFRSDSASAAIFRAFGEAVRAQADRRTGPRQAAE